MDNFCTKVSRLSTLTIFCTYTPLRPQSFFCSPNLYLLSLDIDQYLRISTAVGYDFCRGFSIRRISMHIIQLQSTLLLSTIWEDHLDLP